MSKQMWSALPKLSRPLRERLESQSRHFFRNRSSQFRAVLIGTNDDSSISGRVDIADSAKARYFTSVTDCWKTIPVSGPSRIECSQKKTETVVGVTAVYQTNFMSEFVVGFSIEDLLAEKCYVPTR